MAKISIFAAKAFLSTKPNVEFVYRGIKPVNGYLKRVSSMIRADQVAEEIGAKLNPKSGYKKDVCIYVKPDLNKKGDIKFEGKSSYLDILDDWNYIPILKKHPKVTVITASERDFISMSHENLKNKIILIPQHHCNFDREVRTRKEIKTLGVIGNKREFDYLPKDLEFVLSKRGIKLLKFSEFFTRQDIVDFYKKIDVQIVWRPYRKKLANPLKIVNAASFGIPTIALDEIYFKEMGNCYIGARDLRHFVVELDLMLSSPGRYKAFSYLCLKKAEEYHITKIANLYKNLE